MPISKDFPSPEEVMKMEPEELAPFVLRHLQKQDPQTINRYNFSLVSEPALCGELGPLKNKYAECLMEAWTYLEREGFIAPRPGQQDSWAFVTRKGRRVADMHDFNAYRQSYLLPPERLDALLLHTVKPTFVRGDYDTAVFQAFKEVEVRVRQKAKMKDTDIGVALMQAAFRPAPNPGPLTDAAAPGGEQVAMMSLFAGAIGSFKNPSSHRKVALTDPKEVADIILIANQLLRIVDSI